LRQFALSLAGLTVGVLLSPNATAFCRETTCYVSPAPSGCVGSADANGCSNEGNPLHWSQPCLSFSVQMAGSVKLQIGADLFERQVRTAFDSWSTVICSGGGSPKFSVVTYPQAACTEVGFRDQGPNQNLWVFRDDGWEHALTADGALALTTLSVISSTGEIYDADVELNSHDNAFTTDDLDVKVDLYSIVLHEAGHVLGIGHSPWSTSTMTGSYANGSIDPRSLEADDINAICAVMPPGEIDPNCKPEPLHGFSTECAPTAPGCCSVAAGWRSSNSRAWVIVVPWLVFAIRRAGSGKGRRRSAPT